MEIMNKKLLLQFLDSQKYPALIVGIIFTSIHFIITPMLEALNDNTFALLVWLTLTAPTFTLDNLGDKISFLRPVAKFVIFTNHFLFIGFSSFIYGVTGGLLASKKKYMQLTGIILLCIFIFTGITLCMLAGFVQG
jgi:hypothetical protein